MEKPLSLSSSSSLHALPDEYVDDGPLECIDPLILAPLHQACAFNNCDKIFEYINEEGMKTELNSCDNRGHSALHYACRYESVEAVKILVEQPLIQLDLQNNINKTPLHLAANHNKTPAIIKLLIEAGCDVNLRDRSGNTALHFIIVNSSDFSVKVEMGRLLLENGFDLTRVDNFYLLYLILEPPENMEYYKNGDEEDAQFKDYLNFISMFLYYNIDVNCQRNIELYNRYDKPFEILLAYNRINAVIDLFIDFIDDFNFDFDYSTKRHSYLMLAIECKYPRVLEMVNKGADINFTTPMGSCLCTTLRLKNNQLFKYFWNHCNLDEALDHEGELLYNVFMDAQNFPPEDFLETIYIILESKYALQLLNWSARHGIYSEFLTTFSERGYSKEVRLKVLYTILSINNEISCNDLKFIYESYGFNEEFEAFLIVNTRIFDILLYSDIDIYDNDRFLHIINPQLKMRYTHLPLTLKELSRDVFRTNIKYKLFDPDSTCLDFYSKIQSMKIPRKIKDILVLKEHLSEVYVKTQIVEVCRLHRGNPH